MPVTINGTTGIAGVDGSAGTPAVQGSDTNTGIFFPAADTIAFGEGGSEIMRITSAGNVGIGTTSPAEKLDVNGSVALRGSTSGSVVLSVPSVAGSTTLTLPATTGTVLNDATVGVCRAWVNFNGTGTVAIRASFNVTSITDNGVGDYTVNFTNALADANYSVVGCMSPPYGTTTAPGPVALFAAQRGAGNWTETTPTTSSFRITQNSTIDNSYITLSVFR